MPLLLFLLLMQVLISLQSMVLVSDLFKEPGGEFSMHTSHGKEESRKYNEDTKSGCQVPASQLSFIGDLASPPAAFKASLQAHGQLEGQEVLEIPRQWVLEARKPGGSRAGSLKQVEAALGKVTVMADEQQ